MRKYLLTLAMFGVAAAIAVGGINTQVFANGTQLSRLADTSDEEPPQWAFCNVSLDCLRF